MSAILREPFRHAAMPRDRRMNLLDEGHAAAPVRTVFEMVRDVERWPVHLPHYRFVRFRERARDGGGIVEMAANRPFGTLNWPTWWLSEMSVDQEQMIVRFLHIGGITTGMDVEWSFEKSRGGTHVRLLHVWNGPRWPLVGDVAARRVIGPVFIHGIASRTIAGLTNAAAQSGTRGQS